MKQWNDTDTEEQVHSDKHLSQCHFVYNKYYMFLPGIEPGPSRQEVDDQTLQPWIIFKGKSYRAVNKIPLSYKNQ
jgi:hypothetical protein